MSSSEHQHCSLPCINQEGEAVLKAALPSLPPACPQHYPSALKVKEASKNRIITTEERVTLHHSQGGDRTSMGRVQVSCLAVLPSSHPHMKPSLLPPRLSSGCGSIKRFLAVLPARAGWIFQLFSALVS